MKWKKSRQCLKIPVAVTLRAACSWLGEIFGLFYGGVRNGTANIEDNGR